jgi:hypothetical protein
VKKGEIEGLAIAKRFRAKCLIKVNTFTGETWWRHTDGSVTIEKAGVK